MVHFIVLSTQWSNEFYEFHQVGVGSTMYVVSYHTAKRFVTAINVIWFIIFFFLDWSQYFGCRTMGTRKSNIVHILTIQLYPSNRDFTFFGFWKTKTHKSNNWIYEIQLNTFHQHIIMCSVTPYIPLWMVRLYCGFSLADCWIHIIVYCVCVCVFFSVLCFATEWKSLLILFIYSANDC